MIIKSRKKCDAGALYAHIRDILEGVLGAQPSSCKSFSELGEFLT